MSEYILNEGYKNNSFIFERGIGSKIYIKKKEFIDLSFSAGSLILGHQSKIFSDALKKIINKKISILAAPNKQAIDFSKILKKLFPRYSKFIFCSTGSEAVMKSIRIAKSINKKKIIICVTGSWHGSNDKTLFSTDKKLKPFPISSGLSKYDQSNIKFIPYNDINLSKKILDKFKKQICCILIEPIQAGLPDVSSLTYLNFLNRYSKRNNKILIFDETITGLRTNCSSVQSEYNLKPDITTLGKCFGGGLPIGIIALDKNIKTKINKNKLKVFFGGTFSGNSISTFVGKQTVEFILKNKKKIFGELEKKRIFFYKGLQNIIKKNNLKITFFSFHSMFRIVFSNSKINNRVQRDFFEKKNVKKIILFRKFLLSRGIYYPANGIIFLSYKTSTSDIKQILSIFEIGLKKYFKK